MASHSKSCDVMWPPHVKKHGEVPASHPTKVIRDACLAVAAQVIDGAKA